jgi:hypothetical protein
MNRVTRSLIPAIAIPVVVIAAGTPAVAGGRPATAEASSPVHWSRRAGPVPGVTTSQTPALSAAIFPGKQERTLLFWDGTRLTGGAYVLDYASSASVPGNKWSRPESVGKAFAAGPPSAAAYGEPSSGQVIVAWEDIHGNQIDYVVGTAGSGGLLSFGPIYFVPGATTSSAPVVFRPLHSDTVLLAWKQAGSTQIRYVAGAPASSPGPVMWRTIATIPNAATSASPAVADVSTGRNSGRLYVVWKGTAADARIYRSWIPDRLPAKPHWSKRAAFPATKTRVSPAAIAINTTQSSSGTATVPDVPQRLCPFCKPILLVVFQQDGPHYRILGSTGTVSPSYGVPGLSGPGPLTAGAGWVGGTSASAVFLVQPSRRRIA